MGAILLVIIVNLSTAHLHLVDRNSNTVLASYPIAYGFVNTHGQSVTPTGSFSVKTKAKIGPPTTEIKYGSRILGLGHWFGAGRQFSIHGTDKPELVGQAVSDGCIRLRNKDVEDLYERVPIGTMVVVTD
jgi:lipoprotein-anchoring transpeptidase ErfK/SrfK